MASCVRRNIESHINELLNHFPSVVLEGARQVGKSTLAAHAAPDGSVLLNLDRQETRDAAISDPEGFVAAAGDGTLVIDEIQRVPALTLAIKALIDADRRPGRFLLTGS
ncbi:AAA family ATPase [Acidipropionibacterium acidipropionici]|uniref:AAA family ATPase n=1 Tax=Acidipropionibacterium acidipropionici TaxID=1748 RepID=UPI001C2F6B77|nr:AAA family ATPase [Acidipropionibacterium acidipropionici]